MLSSRKLIKQEQLTQGHDSKKIETQHQPKLKPVSMAIFTPPAGASAAELKQLEHDFYLLQKEKTAAVLANEERQRHALEQELVAEKAQFYAELATLKADMLAAAEAEISTLKETAYTESFQQGEMAGKEAGFAAGEAQVREEMREERETIRALLRETHEGIKTYKLTQQAELLQLASRMAAKILQQEISLSEKDSYLILEPILQQLNTVDNFVTVYVPKNKVSLFQRELEKLKSEQPLLKYIVLADETLAENGCVLETDFEVIDLDLENQLNRMVNSLNEVNHFNEI